MMFKDYYKILGFDTNKVTLDEIKNAYREKAKTIIPVARQVTEYLNLFLFIFNSWFKEEITKANPAAKITILSLSSL